MKYFRAQSVLKLSITILSVWFSGSVPVFASDITPDTVIDLANRDRRAEGLGDLLVNGKLSRAAQAKADDMVEHEYFAHTSPEGATPWRFIQGSGYSYRYAGENLAIHFTSAEEEERAWMESVKHRENILNPKYQDIGVAVAHTVRDGQPTTIVVQMFGLPSGASIPKAPQASSSANVKQSVAGILVATQSVLIPEKAGDAAVPVGNQKYVFSYADAFMLLLRWVAMVVAALMSFGAILMIMANRKMLYLKYFQRAWVAPYRG